MGMYFASQALSFILLFFCLFTLISKTIQANIEKKSGKPNSTLAQLLTFTCFPDFNNFEYFFQNPNPKSKHFQKEQNNSLRIQMITNIEELHLSGPTCLSKAQRIFSVS